jgi:hypothetical protein
MDGEERTTKYAEGAKWETELLFAVRQSCTFAYFAHFVVKSDSDNGALRIKLQTDRLDRINRIFRIDDFVRSRIWRTPPFYR